VIACLCIRNGSRFPPEQINPATLAIDKLSPADIVEGMLNVRPEDAGRRAAAEKERIAVGVEILTQALRKNGRIVFGAPARGGPAGRASNRRK